jgi:hypothetical protein
MPLHFLAGAVIRLPCAAVQWCCPGQKLLWDGRVCVPWVVQCLHGLVCCISSSFCSWHALEAPAHVTHPIDAYKLPSITLRLCRRAAAIVPLTGWPCPPMQACPTSRPHLVITAAAGAASERSAAAAAAAAAATTVTATAAATARLAIRGRTRQRRRTWGYQRRCRAARAAVAWGCPRKGPRRYCCCRCGNGRQSACRRPEGGDGGRARWLEQRCRLGSWGTQGQRQQRGWWPREEPGRWRCRGPCHAASAAQRRAREQPRGPRQQQPAAPW